MKITVLTPVRNEAWILERFLESTSLWADEIVVADQHSSDGTRDIARRFSKVQLVENESATFNEPERQALLIEAARSLSSEKRVLIALDADEILSAEALEPSFRQRLERHSPGTVLHFERHNLRPGCEQYWEEPMTPVGFVDDGSPHLGRTIHSPRIPLPQGADPVSLTEPVILHYHAVNWERMAAKMRWYQCHELATGTETCATTLYRKYHSPWVAPDLLKTAPDRWFEGYDKRGIDLRSTPGETGTTHWDDQFADLLHEHGIEQFSGLGVWTRGWDRSQRAAGLRDPRNLREKCAHRLLEWTQPRKNRRGSDRIERVARKLLKRGVRVD